MPLWSDSFLATCSNTLSQRNHFNTRCVSRNHNFKFIWWIFNRQLCQCSAFIMIFIGIFPSAFVNLIAWKLVYKSNDIILYSGTRDRKNKKKNSLSVKYVWSVVESLPYWCSHEQFVPVASCCWFFHLFHFPFMFFPQMWCDFIHKRLMYYVA